MRTLIVGGSGFVGRKLAKSYEPSDVAYFSRHNSEELDSLGIEYIKGDITDAESVMKAVENFEVIINLAGIWNEKEQKFNDVHLKGIKNLVAAIKKYDKDQKLISISTMNTDFGLTEFYRSKRIGEDNVQTLKTGLVVKPSVIFGEGDHITDLLIDVAGRNFRKFPGLGDLAPVHISDFVEAIRSLKDQSGTIYICSREKLDAVQAMNIIRTKIHKRKIKPMTVKTNVDKLLKKLAQNGVGDYDDLYALSMNRFRETTYLPRVVKEPKLYSDYLNEYLSKH